jgi:hypothetical protein
MRALPEVPLNDNRHKVFSVVETLWLCTGRYTKHNELTPKTIDQIIVSPSPENGLVPENKGAEYGERYRTLGVVVVGSGG